MSERMERVKRAMCAICRSLGQEALALLWFAHPIPGYSGVQTRAVQKPIGPFYSERQPWGKGSAPLERIGFVAVNWSAVASGVVPIRDEESLPRRDERRASPFRSYADAGRR